MLFTEEQYKLTEMQLYKTRVSHCKLCKGKGFTEYEDDGYTLSKKCSCVKDIERDMRLLDWGVPRKYVLRNNEEDTIRDKEFYPKVMRYVNTYLDMPEGERNLFVFGNDIYASLINSIIAKHLSMLYVEEGKSKRYLNIAYSLFSDIMRMRFDDDKRGIMNQLLYDSDVLMLDNIGTEYGRNENKFSQNFLTDIVKKRDNDCKTLILSSRLSGKEIRAIYGEDLYYYITNGKAISAKARQDDTKLF